MSAKFGLASKQSLITGIREKYGKAMALIVGLSVFIVTVSFQSGNSIGAGLAFAELFSTSPSPWIIFFTAAAIVIIFFQSFYRILEKIMIGLVAIMLFSFLFTLFLADPDPLELARGFIPKVPEGAELLSIALVATGFSVVGAFFQSYLVQEKGWGKRNIQACLNEAKYGIIFLGLISSMVLIAAGAVLNKAGISVNSAADMGKALEPLFGRRAFEVFMVGLFAASFSSLIGNATLGGAVLADTLGLGKKLNSTGVRSMIVLVIVAGALIATTFSSLQLQLIVLAQGFTVIMAPVIGIVIYIITSSYQVMGKMTNRLWSKTIGLTGLFVLVVLAIYYIYVLII
jgi:Mn2+/Fe2+ NRAMP family transporter